MSQSATPPPSPVTFFKVGVENFGQRPKKEGGGVEVFKKGVKEWERGAALKRGGLEDGKGARCAGIVCAKK